MTDDLGVDLAARIASDLDALPLSQEKRQLARLLEGEQFEFDDSEVLEFETMPIGRTDETLEEPLSPTVRGEFGLVVPGRRLWALRVGSILVVFRPQSADWTEPTFATLRGAQVEQVMSMAVLLRRSDRLHKASAKLTSQNQAQFEAYPASSASDAHSLELSDTGAMNVEQLSALTRAVEDVLGPVRLHLSSGSWSVENGFDFGVVDDIQADADFLEQELRRLSDRPPDEVLVARLISRLQESLTDLVATQSEIDEAALEQLKAVAIDTIAAIDGVDDLAAAIAAADALAFAASWEAEGPDDIDPVLWSQTVGDGSDHVRIFGRFMGWASDTELTWQNASRATSILTTAVTTGIGLWTTSATAAGVAAGVGAIVTAIVASTLWFIRARLQPAIAEIPSRTA